MKIKATLTPVQMRQCFLESEAMTSYLASNEDANFDKLVHDIIWEVYGPWEAGDMSFFSWMGFYPPKRNLIYEILKELDRLPKSLVEHEAAVQGNIEEYERIKSRGFKGFLKAAEDK